MNLQLILKYDGDKFEDGFFRVDGNKVSFIGLCIKIWLAGQMKLLGGY